MISDGLIQGCSHALKVKAEGLGDGSPLQSPRAEPQKANWGLNSHETGAFLLNLW